MLNATNPATRLPDPTPSARDLLLDLLLEIDETVDRQHHVAARIRELIAEARGYVLEGQSAINSQRTQKPF